jgi:superfamily II DNA or RNA helicase
MANISKSILQLQEHQEDAYKNVEKLFENDRYAAVVFPTGCGKSFVTLKYILEHPDAKVLFLSPRCAINEQMYEYVVRQIGGITDSKEKIQDEFGSMEKAAQNFIPGIKALTYQSLLDLDKKDSSMQKIFEQSKPDLIVIDEMHHIKTKNNSSKNAIEDDENELSESEQLELQKEQNKWGNCFNKLLSICPDSKVLGLSATPIRADGANVVERIFENSVASEISLLEAMEAGIINSPQYVVPDFIREEELQSILEQIEQADDEKKLQLKQEYDKLVEYSEKALGIPELMDEHIIERNGKYIVFCKDINDMEEKQLKAKEWFNKIDEDLKVYRVSSKHSDSQKQIDDFNADNSEHLKVMYCVGMLDEGVHLNDISGVILASKTESRPTYFQRLGRVISIDQNSKTLVIDLVNNNEILQDEVYYERGYQITDIEALSEAIDWINEKNDGNLPDCENAKNNKEKMMARRLNRINNKYYKYATNEELLTPLDDETKTKINDILALGKNINLWEEYIQLQPDEELRNNDINDFLKNIEIKGVRKDLKTIFKDVNTSTSLKNALAIQKWCNDNFGDKEIWDKRLPSTTSENIAEKRLGYALSDLRKKIKKYDGIDIENIDNEEDKQISEIVKNLDKEYGVSPYLKNTLEIQNWCNQNFGDKEIWNKELPHTTSENAEEKRLGNALKTLRNKLKKYDGIDIENIDNEEDKQIAEIVKNLDNTYGLSTSLKNALEIQHWCNQNFGDKEIWNKELPHTTSENAEEKRLGLALKNLRKSYRNYDNIELNNITNKEDQQVVKIIRNLDNEYGLSTSLKNALEIQNWCNQNLKNTGNMKLPSTYSTDEEEVKLKSAFYRLKQDFKKYDGLSLEEIENVEDRKTAEIIRNLDNEYNLNPYLKNASEIKNWCKQNFGDKEIWNKELPHTTSENAEEKRLGAALCTLRTKFKKYAGIDIENIDNEEDKQIVEIIRGLDNEYGLSTSLKNALEIQSWCEQNFGNKEILDKRLPYTNSKNEEEKRLGNALKNLRKKLKKYDGIDIENIDNEEDKQIAEIIRNLDNEYGLSVSLKNTLEIQNWCKENFEKTGNMKLPSTKVTDEKEKKLGSAFYNLKVKLKKYEGLDLSEIDNEEDRKIAEIIRNLDIEYGSRNKKIKPEDIAKVGLSSSTELCDKIDNTMRLALEKNKEVKQLE